MNQVYRSFGHFGELLQGKLGNQGPIALVTLPCSKSWVEVKLEDANDLVITNKNDVLINKDRAISFLQLLKGRLNGSLCLSTNMPAGGGAGVSTATLVAIAKLMAPSASDEILASACIQTEGASDPLMFDHPERLLWASREGRVIEQYEYLPTFDVIGGFYGSHQRTDPKDRGFADISDLISEWRKTCQNGSLTSLAKISTESAKRMLSIKSAIDDPTLLLGKELGALGICIAHTGSARGFIFKPNGIPKFACDIMKEAGLDNILKFNAGGQP